MIFIICLFFFGSLGFVFAIIVLSYFCIKDNRKDFRAILLRTKAERLNSPGYSPFTPSKKKMTLTFLMKILILLIMFERIF